MTSLSSNPTAIVRSGNERQRRLTETDMDPEWRVDFRSNPARRKMPGTGRRADNQPAENHENPSRSENRDSGNRDSENAPKPGHEE